MYEIYIEYKIQFKYNVNDVGLQYVRTTCTKIVPQTTQRYHFQKLDSTHSHLPNRDNKRKDVRFA